MNCKACEDKLDPRAEWRSRKHIPRSNGIHPNDYCEACYYELAAGVIPNVCHSHTQRGSGGLTPRQAIKKN